MKSKTILNFLTAVFAMTAFLSLFCLNVYAVEKDNADTLDEVIEILHEQYTDEEVDVFLEQYSEEELILMYEDSLKFECAYVGKIEEIDDPELLELLEADRYVDGTAFIHLHTTEIYAHMYLFGHSSDIWRRFMPM